MFRTSQRMSCHNMTTHSLFFDLVMDMFSLDAVQTILVQPIDVRRKTRPKEFLYILPI